MFGLLRETELAEEAALQEEKEAREAAEAEAVRRAAEAAAAAVAVEVEPAEHPEEKASKSKRKLFDWTQKAGNMLVDWMKDTDADEMN